MERLTFEGNFCDIARCGYPTCPYKDGCSQKQVWERLKQYEDSKLSPEAAAEKFAKKLLDIPENVDLFAETPEERRARSDKWYAQEWEKIKQEIEEMKISEDTMRPENPALG